VDLGVGSWWYMVWFEVVALLNSVVTVFPELWNCENGLYITEFE